LNLKVEKSESEKPVSDGSGWAQDEQNWAESLLAVPHLEQYIERLRILATL
jgi:hypothetical protein